MRSIVATAAVAALALTTVAAGEEPILPAPVETTFYFHGDDEVQTIDENAYAGDSSGILPMDTVAPTDNSYETRAITNYAQGPNARCAGNGLLPVWVGFFEGSVEGFASIEFRVLGGTGGTAVVDVWTDVSGQACNEDYPEPDASVEVTLPTGEGLATAFVDMTGVSADTYLMVQIRGGDSEHGMDNPVTNPGSPVWPGRVAPTDPTAQGRVVYDGTSFLSGITFTCQPKAVATEADLENPGLTDCDPLTR